jgi:hypothetical protein
MPHLGRHAPDSAAARRALRTPHELEKNLHPIGRLLLEPPFEYHSDTSDVTQETTRRQRYQIYGRLAAAAHARIGIRCIAYI